MTFDELLQRIATEPDVTEGRDVRVPTPELRNELRAAGRMSVAKLVADPRHTIERRTFRKGHRLGAPVSSDDLDAWRAAWPRHLLPDDLVALLARADGIHLWADLDTGRAYQGLAPVREWDLARRKMWGEHADPISLSDRYLAISYHADGAAFVVLNAASGRYFYMDSCGADESSPIGATAGELLDWLWARRLRT